MIPLFYLFKCEKGVKINDLHSFNLKEKRGKKKSLARKRARKKENKEKMIGSNKRKLFNFCIL